MLKSPQEHVYQESPPPYYVQKLRKNRMTSFNGQKSTETGENYLANFAEKALRNKFVRDSPLYYPQKVKNIE